MNAIAKAIATIALLLGRQLVLAQQDTVVTADPENLFRNGTGKHNVHVIFVDTATELVRAEGAFLGEKKQGAWLVYNNDTRIERMETYKDGVLDGIRFARYSNGEYERKERYKDGELAEGHCYNDKGVEVPYFKEPYAYVDVPAKASYDVQKYLAKNLQYPEQARAQKLEGTATVKFVVGEDGHIFNAEVVRGFDKECDAEAVRLIDSMKPWKPGKMKGKAVNMWYWLSVPFKL